MNICHTYQDEEPKCEICRITQMKHIQSKGLELFTKKNRDYGDAFAKYGVIGVLIRIQDKISRSISISQSGIQLIQDECIEDTLLDLQNYSAMALMLMEEGRCSNEDVTNDMSTSNIDWLIPSYNLEGNDNDV